VPKVPDSVALTWPVGPHYLRWVDGKGVHAWARYKIKSANWYRAALVIAVEEAGDLDRYVGVQMALDGALGSLCAAVDAAGWGLLEAVERVGRVADSDRASHERGNWESAFELARGATVALSCESVVVEALAGSGSLSPEGWLAQLRMVRDQAVRHNVLMRRFSVDQSRPGRFIEVPGLGQRRPVEYLKSVRKQVGVLVELLLDDIDMLVEPRALAAEAERAGSSRPRQLPDLSARAGMDRPS
jgi:hypothetical protein